MSKGPRHRMTFTVNVRQEFDGTFIAEVAELQGCFAGGDSIDGAIATLREVLPIYLEDVQGLQVHEVSEPIPGPDIVDGDGIVATRELALA